MKASVIVPIYNVEKHLRKCLDSILLQTFQDFEIIAVNDGSTDNSKQILEEYVQEHTNIVAIHKVNGGLGDARNCGVKAAKGEYLFFVDSDDYIHPTMLENMIQKAEKEQLDLVVCDTILQSEHASTRLKSNLNYTTDTVKSYIITHPMACIRMVKRQIMNQVSFHKNIYYEDLHLMPLLALYTKRIGFVEEGLYYYVQHMGSIMNQKVFHKKLLDIFEVVNHVKEAYMKANQFECYHDEIEYLYIVHLLRSATLRFLDYKNTKQYVKQILEVMKQEFPHWKKNPYLKKSSKKFQLICFLAAHRQYSLLKIIKKMQR